MQQQSIGALVSRSIHIKVHPAIVVALAEGIGCAACLSHSSFQFSHSLESLNSFGILCKNSPEFIRSYPHVQASVSTAIAQIIVQSIAAVVVRSRATAINAGYIALALEVSLATHMKLIYAHRTTDDYVSIGYIHGSKAYIALNLHAKVTLHGAIATSLAHAVDIDD